jgi:superfamily II DNA or RNA helicase
MSTTRKSRRPTIARRLAYTLSSWAASPTGLSIVAWQVDEREGAPGYGARRIRVNPIKPSSGVRDQGLIDGGFARLWDANETRDPVHNGIALPTGARGGELFDLLLDGGRLHWEILDRPALTRGPQRQGRAAWRTDVDAVERPAIEVVDADVLGLSCARWIDAPSGRAGEIDPGLSHESMASFLRHAPLNPGGRLPLAARAALTEAGLPLPRERSLRIEGRLRPSPILVAIRLAEPGAAEVEIDARVVFDYDGVEIESSTRGHTARVVRDDEVIERSRWLVLERQMIEEPVASGFSVATAGRLRWSGSEDKWWALLEDGLAALERRGWTVRTESEARPEEIDRWFAHVTPAATSEFEQAQARAEAMERTGRTRAPRDVPAAGPTGRRWFVSLGVEIDGERVDVWPAVLEAIATARRKDDELDVRDDLVVRVGERMIRIPAARLQAIIDLVRGMGDAPLDPSTPLRGNVTSLAALDVDEWEGELQAASFFARLQRLRPIERIAPPSSLGTELRDYQRDGLTWLQFLGRNEFGGVLADDMGLGKTVQVLSHLLVEAASDRLEGPSLVVAPTSVVQGWMRESARFAPRLRTVLLHGPKRDEAYARLDEADLAITTYGVLLRDAERLDRAFHLVVLDEAQAIKNPGTKVAAAARTLRAKQRVCLTGTPIENNLQELWSLFAFAEPALLGPRREFARTFRTPIEQRNDQSRLIALRNRVRPFMLRRTKSAVLDQLPPKTEVVRHCEIAGDQRDLYESVRISMSREVREALRQRGIERSQMVILEALLKLRQVCCDPRLVKSPAARRVQNSAKLEQLMALLGGLLPAGRRVLLFSQFTSMLTLIAGELDRAGIRWLELTGSTRNRQAVVDRFQAGEAPVFLISLKAGGTGLNLTAADTVIHYDPWWNPAVEDQATDRAHRIGQDKPVTAYRLVARGTVEETMLAMQRAKRTLADGLHERGGSARSSGLRFDERDVEALLEPLA